MSHLPTIITDLSMILLVAGITTILFKKINQPLVLGGQSLSRRYAGHVVHDNYHQSLR